MDTAKTKQAIKDVLNKYGLTVTSKFIPWSRSRNKNEKYPSLNWNVTLVQNGKEILTTEYSAGMGHAPSYKQGDNIIYRHEQIKNECERGKTFSGVLILPDSLDVMYSLLMDSEVLEYATFEEWADSFGYNADSRQDEKLYQACLKIALQFKRIGESIIAELREVYQDY